MAGDLGSGEDGPTDLSSCKLDFPLREAPDGADVPRHIFVGVPRSLGARLDRRRRPGRLRLAREHDGVGHVAVRLLSHRLLLSRPSSLSDLVLAFLDANTTRTKPETEVDIESHGSVAMETDPDTNVSNSERNRGGQLSTRLLHSALSVELHCRHLDHVLLLRIHSGSALVLSGSARLLVSHVLLVLQLFVHVRLDGQYGGQGCLQEMRKVGRGRTGIASAVNSNQVVNDSRMLHSRKEEEEEDWIPLSQLVSAVAEPLFSRKNKIKK